MSAALKPFVSSAIDRMSARLQPLLFRNYESPGPTNRAAIVNLINSFPRYPSTKTAPCAQITSLVSRENGKRISYPLTTRSPPRQSRIRSRSHNFSPYLSVFKSVFVPPLAKCVPEKGAFPKSQVRFFRLVKKCAFLDHFCSKPAHFCQFLRIFAHF